MNTTFILLSLIVGTFGLNTVTNGLPVLIDQPAGAVAAAGDADGPIEVTVNTIIKSNFMTNENACQVGLQAMIQLVWTDSKVKGSETGTTIKKSDVFDPDVQFLNSVKTELRSQQIMGYPKGIVRETSRFYLTLQAKMDYRWYPFDSHVWFADMNSFSKTSDKLQFKPGYVITDPDVSNSVFEFGKNEMTIRTVDAPLFPGQNFSTVHVGIVVKRMGENAFQNIIFPLMLIGTVVYSTFWIDPTKGLPGRTAICIVCILITLMTSGNVGKMLPKISYTTWIDVFLNTVLFFISSCTAFMVLAHRTTKKAPNGKDNIWDYYMRMIYPCVFGLTIVVLIAVGLIASPTEQQALSADRTAAAFVTAI